VRDSNAGAGEFGMGPKRKVGARRGETGLKDFSVEKYFWPITRYGGARR
jgi:hypothetical protein